MPMGPQIIFIQLSYLSSTYHQCHFVLGSRETIMNKIDIAPHGTQVHWGGEETGKLRQSLRGAGGAKCWRRWWQW